MRRSYMTDVFLIDLSNHFPDQSGKLNITIRQSDIDKFGNYKPLIVASPSPLAQLCAETLRIYFRDAVIVTVNYFLDDSSQFLANSQRVWDMVDLPHKRRYKFCIMIACNH